MNKQTIKTYIGIVIGLILSFNVGLYAWSGLQAETGDKLSLSKWNELASNVWGKNGYASYYTAGNVGIGTNVPASILELFANHGNGGPGTFRITAPDSSENLIRFNKSGTNFWSVGQDNSGAGGLSNINDFTFRNGNYGHVLTLMNGGNVGIGTTNTQHKLQIYSSGGPFGLPAVSGTSQPNSITRISGGDVALDFGIHPDGRTWLQTGRISNLSDRFSLLLNPNGGNILIGSTGYPAEKLHIVGTTKMDNPEGANQLTFRNATEGSEWRIKLQGDGNSQSNMYISNNFGTTPLMLKTNGTVGVNTSTPSYLFALDVNGKIRTNSAVDTSSDQRYKKDIKTIESPLDKISKLRGVTFNWRTGEFKDKNFPTGNQVGFIAQEVEKVIPQIVTTDDKGYKSVQYSNVTAVLVEAVKELNKENNILKNENISLKENNQNILKRLENIESKIK